MKTELKVAQALITQEKSVSLAESCTGGLLSHRLTNVPGSSQFLKIGVVSYSNEAKSKILKVPSSLIEKKGAVSEDVAKAMARGVRNIHKTDFGVSITGVAGPDGGTKRKPVGLTYIAVTSKFDLMCLKCQFEGSRESIKKQATDQALELLLEFL